MKFKLSEKRGAAMAADYSAGLLSLAQMRAKYQICNDTIRAEARRRGVDPKTRGGQGRIFSDIELANIYALHDDDRLSMEKIARAHKANPVTIRTILRKSGRSSHWAARGVRHGSWKGGRVVNKAGYVLIRLPLNDPLSSMIPVGSGYVMEHRIVMARSLGRPLTRIETVHHINGLKDDNRIENLQIRQGQHGKGMVHRCVDCGSLDIESITIT